MHQTTLAWPCRLEPDADGRLVVRFTDIPEALTDGANEAEARAEAADALAEAIAGRLADDEPIPRPSGVRRNEFLIPLDALLAYKVALAEAMRAMKMTKVMLAEKMGVDEKEVRRLLDPAYRGSRLPRLVEALAACGVQASATVIDTAKRSRLFRAGNDPLSRRNGKTDPQPATRIKRKKSA